MFIWSGPYAGPISLWLWVIELWFLVENFRMNTDSVDNAVIQNPRFFLEGCIHTTLRFWPISRSFLGLNFKWLIKTQKSVVPPQKKILMNNFPVSFARLFFWTCSTVRYVNSPSGIPSEPNSICRWFQCLQKVTPPSETEMMSSNWMPGM